MSSLRPQNGVEDEDCVNLDVGARDGHWNDLSCNTGESAQGGNGCEKTRKSNPLLHFTASAKLYDHVC